MIEKRIKKIFKISFLIGIRQILLLGKNIYHLLSEPLITLVKIKKDKSQKFLLFIAALSPLLVYGLARIIWDNFSYGGILNSVGKIFFVMLSFQILVFSYLLYWLFRVIFKNNTTKCA